MHAAGGPDAFLEDHAVIVCSDHSQSQVEQEIDLFRAFDGFAVHLANHDVMLWAVSRAPVAKLQAYKRRMGWTFPWASSLGKETDINEGLSLGTQPGTFKGKFPYAAPETLRGQPATTARFGGPPPVIPRVTEMKSLYEMQRAAKEIRERHPDVRSHAQRSR